MQIKQDQAIESNQQRFRNRHQLRDRPVTYEYPRDFIKYGNNLNLNQDKEFTVNIRIYNKNYKILIVTGSEISLINKTIIKNLKLQYIMYKMPKIT